MTRTHPLIAVSGLVLFLSAGAFMSGSTIALAGAEALLQPVGTAAVGDAPQDAQAEIGQAAAIAAMENLGGRMTFDEQTNLTQLDLECTQVTDADLRQLRAFTRLQHLNLSRTQVTDAGLEHLQGMTELAHLELYETAVGDAGLEHLAGLAKLEFLMLKRTYVTDAGADKLRQALPNCLISHSPLNPWPAEIGPQVGRWNVEFANGVQQVCEIRADGTATVVEPARSSGGRVGIQNGTIVIAYDDDRIERWTVVGARLVVEHWAPAAGTHPGARWGGYSPLRPLPTSTPVLGIAERAE